MKRLAFLFEQSEIYKTGSWLSQDLFSVVRGSKQKPQCFRDPLAFIYWEKVIRCLPRSPRSVTQGLLKTYRG